ncbi:hypothetical protein [Pelagicoccus sp. SDUM812003]|uniref:hypothetical protein n=1 Tax=Pelagicoccus sp. SDUM812003 TaxID=3041267 RepID=UPI00280D1174|nr:hypothetical protein [Pelagicoccus sp. SDUM812003]MDQ8205789.1 hypothetical protein [Pelagicoccus sp. SDUM812003]
MKKIFTLLILCLLFPAFSSANESNDSWLYGCWEGADDSGLIGTLTLKPDGTVDLTIGGKSIRDKYANTNSTFVYKYDENQSPAHLDVIRITDGEEASKIPFIIKKIAHDEILIRVLEDNTRAKDWNGTPNDTIKLKRKQD